MASSMTAILMRIMIIAITIACASLIAPVHGVDPPTAKTALGHIKGTFCPSTPSSPPNYTTHSRQVARFLGIRFGTAERWSVPKMFNQTYPSEGLDASAFGPMCPQYPTDPPFPESEDCLFLNVWTPASATPDSKLPVRFFVHGGAFAVGDISLATYDGCAVASDGNVVTVTVNYRLDALGFMASPYLTDKTGYPKGSKGTTGNWGLLDQRLGLQWVQENIKAFGGDPKHVLLHGQSAGGGSVTHQLMMKRSWGLFSSLISQSGVPDNMSQTLKYAHNVGNALIKALGCMPDQILNSSLYRSPRDCMLNQSVEAIHTNSPNALAMPGLLQMSRVLKGGQFCPTIDGVELTDKPDNLFKKGAFAKVPLILGTNANEGASFALAYPEAASLKNSSAFERFLRTFQFLPEKFIPRVVAQYSTAEYVNASSPDWFKAAAAASNDMLFTCTTRRVAGYMAAHTPVRVYLYTQAPTTGCLWRQVLGPNGVIPVNPAGWPLLHSAHTTELPMVFALPLPNVAFPNSTCNYTLQEAELSSWVTGVWSRFAARGEPFPPRSASLPSPSPVKGDWPLYTPKRPQVMQMTYGGSVAGSDNKAVCKVWDDLSTWQWEA